MAAKRAGRTNKGVAKMKLKKGDTVQVITGATAERGGDRGKTGKVIQVFPQTGRVLVEGVNQVTKHRRVTPTSAGASSGGIEVVEAPMHISNVMLVDPETNQPTRVGYRSEEVERDGRTRVSRVRVARRSGKDV